MGRGASLGLGTLAAADAVGLSSVGLGLVACARRGTRALLVRSKLLILRSPRVVCAWRFLLALRMGGAARMRVGHWWVSLRRGFDERS
jgi:hypothetical protein